jgi:phage terminase large subunit
VHRLLADQVALLGLQYEVLQSEIRHPNGTLFIFEGLRHNATKIKSIEGIDICWVEEAERVSEASWAILVPTIRKDGSEIWVTFNPDLETDPTYVRFVKSPPPDSWVVKVNGHNNPFFPEALRLERAYLRAVDPDAAAHVWGGDCRQASEAQILRGKWKVEEFEPVTRASLPPELPEDLAATLVWDGPYHGADFGFAQDPTTLIKVWIYARTLYVEREAYRIGLDIDATAAFWTEQVPGCDEYVVRADNARPESISYLRRHGVPRIVGAPKWAGSVEDGVAHLRQYEQIIIHPRCVNTANEARHYSYKVDKLTGDVLREIVDKHNHCFDAIRYGLGPMIKPEPSAGFYAI